MNGDVNAAAERLRNYIVNDAHAAVSYDQKRQQALTDHAALVADRDSAVAKQAELASEVESLRREVEHLRGLLARREQAGER